MSCVTRISPWRPKRLRRNQMKNSKLKTDVTLGADPELGFLDSVRFISEARNVFDFGPGEAPSTSRFGCDGTDAIAEMRPLPSRDPLQIVRNIRADMIEAVHKHP